MSVSVDPVKEHGGLNSSQKLEMGSVHLAPEGTYFHLSGAGIPGVSHHAQFVGHWELNLEPCLC